MRIATWNIHSCIGWNGKLEPDKTLAVLKLMNADIIALQEVESVSLMGMELLRFFCNALDMQYISGLTMRRGEFEYGNAILYRGQCSYNHLLDISASAFEPRGMIVAKIESGAARVTVAATHFGLNRIERFQQQCKVLDQLKDETDSIVLCGDFNEWWPWSKFHRRFKDEGFAPACNMNTFPSVFPILALDKIFVKNAERCEFVRFKLPGKLRFASDHLPIIADITL